MPHQNISFRLTAWPIANDAGREITVMSLSKLATGELSTAAHSRDYTALRPTAVDLARRVLPSLRKQSEGLKQELVAVKVTLSILPSGPRAPRGFREFKGWRIELSELEPAQAAA